MRCQIEGCDNKLSSMQRAYCSEECQIEGKNLRYRKSYIPVDKKPTMKRQEEIDYLESFGIGVIVSHKVTNTKKEILDMDKIKECL